MTRQSGSIRSSRIATLLLAGAIALPSAAHAQQMRVQLAGSDLKSHHVHLMLGEDEALPIGGGDCPPGGALCTPPDWELLVGAYGGFVVDDIPLSIYAHAGLQYKLSADYGLGLLGFAFMHPFQGGGALRFDAKDVVAIKGGYGWGEEDGFLLALEVSAETLIDVLFR